MHDGVTPVYRLGRSLSRDAASDVATMGELTLLQRQHSLLQEELVRIRGAESRLKDSERARVQLERQLRDLKSNSAIFNEGAGGSQVTDKWLVQVVLLTAIDTH